MKEGKTKLLVVSHAFAPYASGSAVLLANLLREYPGECMAIGGYSRYMKEDKSFTPPCPTVFLKPLKGKFFELAYAKFMNNNRWYVRRFIEKQVKKFRPDAILGAFPHSTFFIAAFEVARKMGLPFYAHMHDLWQENYPEGYYAKKLADQYEALILKNAARVYCMTSTQAEHYAKKYGIAPEILPHTIPQKDLQDLQYRPLTGQEKKVLFAGALSDVMNADALSVFSQAIRQLPDGTTVNFFTSASAEQLEKNGIDVSKLNLKWVSRAELEKELKTSAVLFAPLSHKNCSALEVKTVFSTKLLEYLVAGRPILLFAPADSFHTTSARKNDWAQVVDQDDPTALYKGLQELLQNEARCREVVDGAFREARERNAVIFARQLDEAVRKDSRR
ncbi:MAG TPA: glycosyltransferase [Flavisolibacter sp.]|nr:glycosyltransferase [Flavisolibacter sp.]